VRTANNQQALNGLKGEISLEQEQIFGEAEASWLQDCRIGGQIMIYFQEV
jgi:hypothetical protein